LDNYLERYPAEVGVVERFRTLIQGHSNCFERTCWAGHITGSAWLVDPAEQQLLLTHHRKLQQWLQLGGHSDGDPDTRAVTAREAQEESGLAVQFISQEIFDIDIHAIPARKTEPEHFHFDVRYCLRAEDEQFVVSDESLALAWVPIDTLERKTTEESILRMKRKWLHRCT